ncbi:MAG: hypothetical protein ACRD8A_14695 [Candidatus Acidiferrales bacterium]
MKAPWRRGTLRSQKHVPAVESSRRHSGGHRPLTIHLLHIPAVVATEVSVQTDPSTV